MGWHRWRQSLQPRRHRCTLVACSCWKASPPQPCGRVFEARCWQKHCVVVPRGAALDDMAVCDLFLKWLADVRPLCLFVVTNINARVLEGAGIDSSDDFAASRCGALSWLLSRLRNTNNLHVLFTTTASRATTASVAPVVATLSFGSSGAHHAGAAMKLLASAYSLPMGPFSSLPYPAKSAGCPSCPNCGLELDAHNMAERGLLATGAQLHGDSAANSATVKPCRCQDQSQRAAAHTARILH